MESTVMGFLRQPKIKKSIIITTGIIIFMILTIRSGPDISKTTIHRSERRSEVVFNKTMCSKDQKMRLSTLGKILYCEENLPPKTLERDKNKIKIKFKIVVWKYGKAIENRHLKHFSNKYVDIFEKCSVSNCDISFNDTEVETADLVMIHLHRTKGVQDLPTGNRKQEQIWAFLTDESPYNTFMTGAKLINFNGIFNWSMTYRSDSDIPVPYGRTVKKELDKEEIPPDEDLYNKRRDVLVAIMGSNCNNDHNKRWEYVKKLEKHIPVHIYGGCGPKTEELKCGGHFREDCPKLNKYIFYLAFENSNCNEYLTEKIWWNAYHKNSIPIVMGTSKEVCNRLLPPDSFLHVDDFANEKSLADYIISLNNTEGWRNYYDWKKTFEVKNEHGYFKSESFHFCRACEALNYNNKGYHVYDKLEDFWSVERDCVKKD